jgi:hypothetical protein
MCFPVVREKSPALGGCLRAVSFLQALGISRPEPLFGFSVRSVESSPARFRTEIMGALVVIGGKLDLARVERLAADGIHCGFRNRVILGHEPSSLKVYGC